MEQLGQDGVESRRVVIISQESFYRELCEEEAGDAKVGNFDFDHPDAFDYEMTLDTLRKAKSWWKKNCGDTNIRPCQCYKAKRVYHNIPS
ncbi:UMP-CMP kinase [Desmophyllum pertusum]|uniref:UMP-CMP kinase n=1 Tax=Desmophyllum pertusum TaxID=174260 RepID=A0A9W9YNR7_9CNID|nr:UMP-CMP kinase [Desmophyllum pertusum]